MPSITEVIIKLQRDGTLPAGEFQCEEYDNPFSTVNKVVICQKVYYFKRLKQRDNHAQEVLVSKITIEYEALTKYCKIFSSIDNFNVPMPVYCSENELLIVTKELEGENVLDIGRRYASNRAIGGGQELEIFKKVGKFLNIFHNIGSSPLTADKLDSLINYIRTRLFTGIFNRSEEQTIDNYLISSREVVLKSLRCYTVTQVHHDFGPGNILSYNDDINVLDFGDTEIDAFYQDIVVFKIMLERQLENRLKYSRKAVRELVESFSTGYGIDVYQLKDPLYFLYVLKLHAIFLASFRKHSKWKFSYQDTVNIREGLVNLFEYYKFKRAVLQICSGTYS